VIDCNKHNFKTTTKFRVFITAKAAISSFCVRLLIV